MSKLRPAGGDEPVLADARKAHVFYRAPVGPRGLACWIAQPPLARAKFAAPPLVAVHGISRNAREMVQVLTRVSERTGRTIVVPRFDKSTWRGYQQVVRPHRADLALLRLLEDLAAEGFCKAERFELFGYSGGAQFCHRFAMLYPHRVTRLVLGAAGWYTMPLREQPFPLGIGPDADEGAGDWGPQCARGLERFLALPIDVAVGECDNRPDAATRSHPDLDALQGTDRLARAEAWVRALHQTADALGVQADARLHRLPGCGHSFRHCALKGRLLELIAGDREALSRVEARLFSVPSLRRSAVFSPQLLRA